MESPSHSLRESIDTKVLKEREGPRHVRLNRKNKDAALVLFGDDLTFFNATHFFKSIGANVKLRGGKWYYEVTLHTEHLFQIGWSQHFRYVGRGDGSGTGDDKESYGYDGKRCLAWNDFCLNYGTGWHVGDVIGCYIDLTDLNQTRIGYTQNGVDLGIIFTTTIKPATGISPSLSCDWLQSATVNFGATPFKYSPPTGHIGLEIDVDVDYYVKNYWLQSELDRPLIYWAIEKNQVDNVRTLLSTMNKDELSTVTDEGTHLLTAAVSRNAHEIVELLLNAGAKVTGKMLHQAAHFDAIESLKLLVKNGGDVEAENDHNMTPVQSALRAGSERCFHYLHHECKAKLTGHSKARENSLHFAVVGGGANALQTLAENLRTYADERDGEEKTPLFYAVGADNPAAIEALVTQFQANMKVSAWGGSLFSEAALGHFLSLQKLVELGCTPDENDSPIWEAARLGYYDGLHFLLQNSQKLNLQVDPQILGRVAFKTLKNKYNKCLEVLLDYGAPVELGEDHILFHTLASPVCTKTVLDRCPPTKVPGLTLDTDDTSTIVDGETTTLKWHVVLPDNCRTTNPFISAGQMFMGSQWQIMMYFHEDQSTLCLYIGCTAVTPLTAETTVKVYNPADRSISETKSSTLNYDSHNWLGWGKFLKRSQNIINNNAIEVEIELFAARSDPSEEPDANKFVTPLHLASDYNAVGVMELLLSNNVLRAAINDLESFGHSPLHWAASCEADHCMAALLREGADPNVLNKKRYTPLHYAAVKGFTKGVKLLLEHHADVNLRTPADQTALLVALQAHQPHKMKDTVLALLEHEATDLTAVVPTTKASLLTLVDRMLPAAEVTPLDVFDAPENKTKFNNKEQSNVTFVVDGKEIYATRELVDQHCDYFSAMFGSNMKETTQSTIPIQNFSYDLTFPFLEFLHIGKAADITSKSIEDIAKLLEVAEVFFSDPFSDFIELELIRRLTLENASKIYNLAVDNSLVHVLHGSFEFLKKNSEKALNSPQSMDVARHYLTARLRGDL
jgi:ankyrin repeat protein